MPRPPRKPRTIARSTAAAPGVGQTVVPRRGDPRQPDLFAVPFIPPCKPKLADKLPIGDRWQYEIKADGYRVQAHVLDGRVTLYSKTGRSLTGSLPGVVVALAGVPARSAVIDGEAVMPDAAGRPDFFALHAAMANFHAPDAMLIAFDLLHLDGEDWRPRPLVDRQVRLATLLAGSGVPVVEHEVGDGPELLRAACAMGLEGIVAKRRDTPYRAGYVDTWVKVKCTEQTHFAVLGFDPAGPRGVSSLRLARLVDGELRPCGSVGSGIDAASSAALRKALDAGQVVVAEVEFRGVTPAGELRHPVFRGWWA